MSTFLRNLSLCFAAGCFGGLANSMAVWLSGRLGISSLLALKIAPSWTPAWLYPRLVWGGLWGLLFLLPLWQSSIIKRGLIYSLGPTLVVCLIVFPFQLKKGWFGLELGTLTPLFALVVNMIWGLSASAWLVQVMRTQ